MGIAHLFLFNRYVGKFIISLYMLSLYLCINSLFKYHLPILLTSL